MAAKSRKANWSENEVSCLVDSCVDNIKMINGKHGDATERDKGQFWKELTDRINCQGCSGRTCEEIVKKWKDLKSQTKKKEQLRRKAMKVTGGGGPVNSLKNWEEKIVTVIPNSVLDGVEGGQDIFQSNDERLKEICMDENEKSSSKDICSGPSDNMLKSTDATVSPANIYLQVKDTEDKCMNGGSKRRKRSCSEIEAAQLEFYKENTLLCREQRKLTAQQLRTLAAQEAFFSCATKKLKESEELSNFLRTFTEQ